MPKDTPINKTKQAERQQAKERIRNSKKSQGVGQKLWEWLQDFAKVNGLDIGSQ